MDPGVQSIIGAPSILLPIFLISLSLCLYRLSYSVGRWSYPRDPSSLSFHKSNSPGNSDWSCLDHMCNSEPITVAGGWSTLVGHVYVTYLSLIRVRSAQITWISREWWLNKQAEILTLSKLNLNCKWPTQSGDNSLSSSILVAFVSIAL